MTLCDSYFFNYQHNLLLCFVVLVSCSAKLSRKQYYNNQSVAESELDILDVKSLEGQGALFVL